MVKLDPSHELPAPESTGHEWLGAENEPSWWIWILALIISTIATFSVILALLAAGTSVVTVAFVAPVIFIMTTFVSHAVVGRAR